jgi:hypothetical protein
MSTSRAKSGQDLFAVRGVAPPMQRRPQFLDAFVLRHLQRPVTNALSCRSPSDSRFVLEVIHEA